MTLDEIARLHAEACPQFAVFAKDKLPLPGVKKRLDDAGGEKTVGRNFKQRNSGRRFPYH